MAGSLALVVALAVAAPPPPTFVATGAAGDTATGALVRFGPDRVDVKTIAGTTTAVRDVLALKLRDRPLPPWPAGPFLLTAAGDRVPGRVVGGDGTALPFRPDLGTTPPAAEWRVPLAAAAAVWVARPSADTRPDPGRYPWRGEPDADAIALSNGDVLRGTVDEFADGPGVRVKPADGPVRAVPLADVAAVAFNPALARGRKPRGPFARVVLRNGTRLAVATPTADATTLRGKTLFGAVVELPLGEVVAVDILQGKATYLADLPPPVVEQVGYLGVVWPPGANRTAGGEPLRLVTPLGVELFDGGVGVRPRTTLTYALGGKYRRFEAVVGLDAVGGRAGSAVVRVRVDGKDVDAGPLTPGTVRAVSVPVAGAKSLTLLTDFGDGGDVLAEVDWADARVVE